MPGRPSAQCTARRRSAGSVSGAYQVAWVGCSPSRQRRRATDLIVCTATPRSRQVATRASKSGAYPGCCIMEWL
jgi:hypothetical protein